MVFIHGTLFSACAPLLPALPACCHEQKQHCTAGQQHGQSAVAGLWRIADCGCAAVVRTAGRTGRIAAVASRGRGSSRRSSASGGTLCRGGSCRSRGGRGLYRLGRGFCRGCGGGSLFPVPRIRPAHGCGGGFLGGGRGGFLGGCGRGKCARAQICVNHNDSAVRELFCHAGHRPGGAICFRCDVQELEHAVSGQAEVDRLCQCEISRGFQLGQLVDAVRCQLRQQVRRAVLRYPGSCYSAILGGQLKRKHRPADCPLHPACKPRWWSLWSRLWSSFPP